MTPADPARRDPTPRDSTPREWPVPRELFDELHLLTAASLCGDITPEQSRRLENLLQNPAALDLYVELMFEDYALLVWADHGKQDGLTTPDRAKPELVTPKLLPPASLPAAQLPPPLKSPVLGFLGGVVDYVSHSRRLMLLLVAGMLCGWFIFQIGSVLIGRWWAGNADVAVQPGDRPDGPPNPASGLAGTPRATSGQPVAWVSGSVGARWQIVAANPAEPEYWDIGKEFPAGQQVKLVAGLGEITFRSGAKVVVTSPAQFSVVTPLRTDLHVGKLAARVPHDTSQSGASGFAVNTSAGSVVDLGTEFGVEVTPDQKLDVQVFVGEVKIDRPAGSEVAGDGPADPIHVQAGQTVHVETGKPAAVVETKENRFHRDLQLNSDSHEKQVAAYLDFIRQLKPVVWYRLDGKEGDTTIHDEMGKGADGKLHWDGPGNPFVDCRLGKGLWLRGPTLKDYATVRDYPKGADGKLSVSAWVFADSRPNFATIASNGLGGHHKGQFHFGLSSPFGPQGSKLLDSVDLYAYVDQADGEIVLATEGNPHPFPLNEWQHVAFVADGTMLRLYREGREVAAKKCGPVPAATTIAALGIGVTPDGPDKPNGQYPGYWSGRLDDVAIFNAALTAEDIKKLAAAPPR